MPSIKELQAFIAVLEAGSFQGAARRLNATPPAISKRISELELELGVRLFERSTRQCHITARGRALLPYAQRILGDIGDIRHTVGQRSALVGHVRLGVTETIAFSQVQRILAKLKSEFPQLTVEIEVGFTADLARKVRTRELDIACVVAPVSEPGLASEPFWEVSMSWVGPPTNRSRRSLTVPALARETIVLQTGSRHIPVIEGWFKSHRVRPKHVIRCNSLAAALKITAAGLGLSFVPIECARRELDERIIVSVPVDVALPANSFVTLFPVGQLEPALDAVIEVMRDIAAELAAGKARKRHSNGRGGQ